MVLATFNSIAMTTGAPTLSKLPVRHRVARLTGRRVWRSHRGLSAGVGRKSRLIVARAQGDQQEDEAKKLKEITAENLELRKRLRAKLANMQESEKAAFLAEHPYLTQVEESEEANKSVGVASTNPKSASTTTDAHGVVTYNFSGEDSGSALPSNGQGETTSTPAHNPSSPGLTASGRGGRFHMGVYSFSTSMVEETGGLSPKKKKEQEEKKVVNEPPKPTVHETKTAIAQSTVKAHVPLKAVKGKAHWLYFMVPEEPVAGADVVVYYNKSASDSLRYSPKVQIQLGYNEWELESSQSTLDLQPAPVLKEDGSDWWSVQFPISTEGYEMNFIFSDGEGSYDNNDGKDFQAPVVGPMTPELWEEGAAARAALIFKARMKAEEEAAREEEKRRQEAMAKQDLEKAQWRVGELKDQFDELRKNSLQALTSMKGDISWKTRPSPVSPGTKTTILYNTNSGPLSFLSFEGDNAPTIKYGFNGWKNPQETIMKRSKSLSTAKETWWEAEVDVQADTVVINFVVQFYEHFDNNQESDHKVLVGEPGRPSDAWFQALLPKVRAEEEANRLRQEEQEAETKARREAVRKMAREKTMNVSRRQIRHVLFTKPQVVKAGDTVEVFYSSNNTCLNGKEQIYLIGGWNRWKHKKPIGPIKMTPPGPNGDHWQAKVKVPIDAFKMDFVFSDVNGGDGTYDNRGGYDYHLPVEGGLAEEPPLHIVHVAVEMAPIAKVGGLADVVTSLARAVKEQGHLVEIVLPRYEFFHHSPVLNNMVYDIEFEWGGTQVYVCSQIVEGLRVFFIEPKNGFFNTQSVYGRNDDAMRFEFFCKAALEFLLQSGRQPDILHCHDWSTADVASSYWNNYHHSGLWRPKVVFTIHNLNYGQAKISEAAMHSQKFTTVSPTYAREVQDNPTISSQVGKFMGIRNGIDMDMWDPETDQFLPLGYTPDNVVEGKAAARKALSERLGIAGWRDAPLIGVISRLTSQKGVHLIKHSAWRTVDRGGIFVLLGSAPDPKIQGEFDALAGSMGGENAAFYFAYDEPLSHLIYAACDMIVVPSIFEPCGLTQMIAMRYGSVPIVRSTGGLHDTVFDVDHDKGRAAWDMEGSSDWKRDNVEETNGFSFEGTDSGALDFAMNRAIDAFYNDRTWFHSLQKRVMLQDWSWNRPALDYIELYYSTLKS